MDVTYIEMRFNEKCSESAWPIIRLSQAEEREAVQEGEE